MFLVLVVDGDGLDVDDVVEDPDLLSGQYLKSLTDLCLLMLTTSDPICGLIKFKYTSRKEVYEKSEQFPFIALGARERLNKTYF